MAESVIVYLFQSAKLGEVPYLLDELAEAKKILEMNPTVQRIYGVSGGALAALGFALNLSAYIDPGKWRKAANALDDFQMYLKTAHSRNIRSRNLNPLYGPFCLKPLRKWLAGRLKAYCGREDILLSEIPAPLYLCAIDHDAVVHLFGKPDDTRQIQYQFKQVGPPQDACVLDAVEAALSTMLSTSPVMIDGDWYRDCRPSMVDAGGIVVDLESIDPAQLWRTIPYAPVRHLKVNFITSSFIMHSHSERNQVLLTGYYLDLVRRNRELKDALAGLSLPENIRVKSVHHVDLPYVGSTEASTNMRQSVENKDTLMTKFNEILDGQLDDAPFDSACNVIYGAGGFSGILAGLTTTRKLDAGFSEKSGEIRQIYGVSAGVLNGFFHGIQVAARRYPDLYKPAAQTALNDLEEFVATISPRKVIQINLNPANFWKGWANLSPFQQFITDRLAAYTGSSHPESITFDDIALPFTVTVADPEGFTDFLGMSQPRRCMHFAGRTVEVKSAPIIRSLIAGWSMNTYIQPLEVNGKMYQDGGGPFYDIGLFPACMDASLTDLIHIHLEEPEGHSYRLPARPSLISVALDTHNYTFPEERRRMFHLLNLLYDHFALVEKVQAALQTDPELSLNRQHLLPLLEDFRQNWQVER